MLLCKRSWSADVTGQLQRTQAEEARSVKLLPNLLLELSTAVELAERCFRACRLRADEGRKPEVDRS